MVERVEHLSAELQPELFGNVEPFLNSQIPIVITRGSQIGEVAWGITEGIRSRLLKGRRVEPLMNTAVRNVVRVSHDIGMLIPAVKRTGKVVRIDR